MAELARGAVADRPWGRTLGALGLRGLTGQLTLGAEGKRYLVAFRDGGVVGAHSPLASDAAVRIAMTGHLVSSSQVAAIARHQAADPTRDEIELIAEHARLTPEQALRLRRRVVAQRAARTFAIERGEFVVEDEIILPLVPGIELDIRAVVYLGARHHLSEARLAVELGQLGAWFQLRHEAIGDLAQFGFGEAERPILELMVPGADLGALEHSAPGIEQRMVRAVVYALACCNACVVETRARNTPLARPTPAPVTLPSRPPPARPTPTPARTATGQSPDADDRLTTAIPRLSRPAPGDELDPPGDGLDPPTTMAARRPRKPPSLTTQTEVRAVIAARGKLLAENADHFALLGVPHDASPEAIRTAYFALARQLHPDKLAALGIADEARDAQRLFAEVNTAFAVLNDLTRRAEYLLILQRGGEAAIRREQAQAEELAHRALEAEDAFRRGEMALRRDQLTTAISEFKRAAELDPETADYQGMLAWSQFCAAPDKMAVAQPTRGALERAIAQAPRAVSSRVLLGRLERMLGRDQDAQRHFQEVLRISPGNPDAASELRVIDARLAQAAEDAKKGGGLFGRKR